MQTYWDLTEKERAQLSTEEVERFVDAELMLKGVLKVKPLQLTPVPEMPKADLNLYVLSHSYRTTDIGFENEAHAGDALNDGVYIEQVYVGGQSVNVVRKFEDAAMKRVQCYSAERFAEARASIEKAAAAKSANERAEREYDAAVAKQDEALKGLWEDWHDCQSKHAELAEVVSTFRDYEKTAGDATTAAKFLAKVFDASKIAEAAEWFAVSIPAVTHEPKHEAPSAQIVDLGKLADMEAF